MNMQMRNCLLKFSHAKPKNVRGSIPYNENFRNSILKTFKICREKIIINFNGLVYVFKAIKT